MAWRLLMLALALQAFLVLPSSLRAQESGDQPQQKRLDDDAENRLLAKDPETDDSGGREGWLKLAAALVLVVGVLLGLQWYLKRFRGGAVSRGNGEMEIVARRGLSPKHQLLLVRVEGRRLLIGMGPEGLSTLADFTPDDPDRKNTSDDSDTPAEGGTTA